MKYDKRSSHEVFTGTNDKQTSFSWGILKPELIMFPMSIRKATALLFYIFNFVVIFPFLCVIICCERDLWIGTITMALQFTFLPALIIWGIALKNWQNSAKFFWCSTLVFWPALYNITELINEKGGVYLDKISVANPYCIHLAAVPMMCSLAPIAISYMSKTPIHPKTKRVSIFLAVFYILFPFLMEMVRLAWT